MKQIRIIMLLIVILVLQSACLKPTGHYEITIVNRSDNDVYLCALFTNGDKCTLSRGGTLEKNSVFEFHPYNVSIEKNLRGGGILGFYLVNPNHYNEHNVFYDCDSISVNNDILEHYRLTLEDLERMNWTVVFPPEEIEPTQ